MINRRRYASPGLNPVGRVAKWRGRIGPCNWPRLQSAVRAVWALTVILPFKVRRKEQCDAEQAELAERLLAERLLAERRIQGARRIQMVWRGARTRKSSKFECRLLAVHSNRI